MKRILVCGGRSYENKELVFRILDAALEAHKEVFIIEGGATGADALAKAWAIDRKQEHITYPAKWNDIERPGAVIRKNRYGKPYDAAAGGVRNQRMIEEGCPDLVLAFPGGAGTKDMKKRATKANITVVSIRDKEFAE